MIGRHLLIDFHEVSAERLDDAELLSRLLAEAARRGGLTPLGPPVLHRFEGGGLTGYLLLSESHIAVHTYPELGFAALDIFACGAGDPARGARRLADGAGPASRAGDHRDAGRGPRGPVLSPSIPDEPSAGTGQAP